ncbi:unnamed protein product [Notodromas monacha]|uniref:BPTI/Kunitz inhibitor domain-containing protein n=1 Tax=Notodromas monacha TaxID=399045 RepID=A0A7R9BX65_9CRUS|nr:unnamed protein product [Notodromas monacha]CAG0922256.1 unnamed protein product [Notodromas monacha]
MLKSNYDPVGKSEPHSGVDVEHSTDKGKPGGDPGFTVRVRSMDRKWLILGAVAGVVLIGVIVAVIVVFVTQAGDSSSAEESPLSRSGIRPEKCLLQPEPGMCRAYFEKYHYDPATDSCLTFVYGGCDGNENRFDSLEECERICLAGNKGVAPSKTKNEPSGPADVKVDDNTKKV